MAAVSAHRRDEYLQAARITIDPLQARIELDLTPGMALAETVWREVDANGDGTIGDSEAAAYAARVAGDLRVDIDGVVLTPRVVSHIVPRFDATLNGEGTIHLELTCRLPVLAAGTHRLRYRNAHHPDIGVYLANALVPTTDRVSVLAQQRDEAQRELTIEYALRSDGTRTRGAVIIACACAAAAVFGVGAWGMRRRRRSRHAA